LAEAAPRSYRSFFVLYNIAILRYIAHRNGWREPPAILRDGARQKQRQRPPVFRCFRAVKPAVFALFSTEKK